MVRALCVLLALPISSPPEKLPYASKVTANDDTANDGRSDDCQLIAGTAHSPFRSLQLQDQIVTEANDFGKFFPSLNASWGDK